MNYFETFNKPYVERYESGLETIKKINVEIKTGKYSDFIKDASHYILKMAQLEGELCDGYFENKTFDELKEINHDIYKDILEENYENSYANPTKCVELFGKEIGQSLTFVYTKIKNYPTNVYEHNIFNMTLYNDLFIEIVEAIESEDVITLKDIIFNNAIEDLEQKLEISLLRRMDPKFDYYSKILTEADLSDVKYLFRYGKYIGHNEIKSAKYINSLPEETIRLMADTYTEAFKKGYVSSNKDLSYKESVNIGYQLGFERVSRLAAENFAKMNLKPIVYDDVFTVPRNRMVSTKPSHQYAYDHRFDDAIHFNKVYTDAFETAYQKVLDKHKHLLKVMAGPAVQESFGEKPFAPVSKEACLKYDDEQTQLKNTHNTVVGQEMNKYLPRSEYSFVIIAYPVPEIGDQFEEIFDGIIKVNTLDSDKYEKIHQSIIDTLDLADYVHVVGMDGNKTDIKIKMNDINNPEKETLFENCVAEVNVPVGEVFTSPKLTGTEGVLHVKEVFLMGLKYNNFEMSFKDGMIEDYTCTNFDKVEENKKYIHENLIHPHKTLPIGEFAIGTNTTAYVMAKKYNIGELLPILIAEKMGPHFAIGDTCFSWAEDIPVFNPDGKEIIARDNEKSCLRKDDISKAYFFKHTDITIPYSELGLIEVIKKDGDSITIIKDSRFVLEGTEALNEAFDD